MQISLDKIFIKIEVTINQIPEEALVIIQYWNCKKADYKKKNHQN